MTEEFLEQAKSAQKNIDDIKKVLNSIERIRLIAPQQRKYSPFLKFVNALQSKGGKEVREAAVYLFDGVGCYGTEVPVDERLLACIKEDYRARLREAQATFEAM